MTSPPPLPPRPIPLPTIHATWTTALSLPATPRISHLRRLLRTINPLHHPPTRLIPLYIDIALTYAFLGEYWMAAITFQQAVESDSGHAFAWYAMGLATAELGFWREARTCWKRCGRCFEGERGVGYALLRGEEWVLERKDVRWNLKVASLKLKMRRNNIESGSPECEHQSLNGIPARIRFGPDWDLETSEFDSPLPDRNTQPTFRNQEPTHLHQHASINEIPPLNIIKFLAQGPAIHPPIEPSKSPKTKPSPPFPAPTKPLPPIPIPRHRRKRPAPWIDWRVSYSDSPTQGRHRFPARSSSLVDNPPNIQQTFSRTLNQRISTSAPSFPSTLSTQMELPGELEFYFEPIDEAIEQPTQTNNEDIDAAMEVWYHQGRYINHEPGDEPSHKGWNNPDEESIAVWNYRDQLPDSDPVTYEISGQQTRYSDTDRLSNRQSRFSTSEDALAIWRYYPPPSLDAFASGEKASINTNPTYPIQPPHPSAGELLLPRTYGVPAEETLQPRVFEGFGPDRTVKDWKAELRGFPGGKYLK